MADTNLRATDCKSTSVGGAHLAISLPSGDCALVSREDYASLSCHSWHLSNGYAVRNIPTDDGQTTIRMHRVIMNAPDDMEVDHINGNRLDNRRSNLRLCTRAENAKNTPPVGESRYKGVARKGRYWRARIMCDGEIFRLGAYPSEEDAAWAYDMKARKLHGSFARTNFDDPLPPNYPEWEKRVAEFKSAKHERIYATRQRNGTTGSAPFRGVSKSGNRFRAQITHGGRTRYIGSFASAEEAAKAYDKMALELCGSDARFNFPEEVLQ